MIIQAQQSIDTQTAGDSQCPASCLQAYHHCSLV